MAHVLQLRDWLARAGLDGVVVPSTDEFTSEFSPPPNRRLCWATGFRGSMGSALIAREAAALFLDSRYLVQGASDVAGADIAVISATHDHRRSWLAGHLPAGARIAIAPWLHSIPDMELWREIAAELKLSLHLLETHPIDELWVDRPAAFVPQIVDYPIAYAGQAYPEKCRALIDHIRETGLAALLVADPEDIAWLLNVRASEAVLRTALGNWHIVPGCTSRVLIASEGLITWFIEPERVAELMATRPDAGIDIVSPALLPQRLRDIANKGPVGLNPRKAPAGLAQIICEAQGTISVDDTVARRRSCKHEREVQAARRAHIIDAAAVVRFMAWLDDSVAKRKVSEFEAARQLEAFRREHPQYKGPSMPLMSASGSNGAKPHYTPAEQGSRVINEHPIYWMDSGGQYFGGSTDNTLTMALGHPEPKHVLAHTAILKGLLALTLTRFPQGTSGLRLDVISRLALWDEGMDFGHNTGHGVGNYLNIHEAPSIGREPGPATLMPLEPGMIVTNEPGYYAADDFGMRLETHMVVVEADAKGFLTFDTISRLPIDPRLVDFSRLSHRERTWLSDYHGTVLNDLAEFLDNNSYTWLRQIAEIYVEAAGS